MEDIFTKRPLVPVLASYATGILLAKILSLSTATAIILLFISITILAYITINKKIFNLIYTTPIFLALGILIISPYTDNSLAIKALPDDHYKNVRIEGIISSNPDYSKNRIKLRVNTFKILETPETKWAPFNTGILLTIKDTQIELHKGDTIAFLTSLKTPRNFGNPFEFDYEWWIKKQSIDFTATVKEGLVIKTTADNANHSFISLWRSDIRNFINNNNFKHYAILKALTIGEKSDITKETRDSFAKTGTAHLLAISGLHMGLVAYISFFLILNLLKTSERLTNKFNIIKTSYIVATIPVIIYGTLSGFQISALRSAIMVIIFALTLALGRTKDHYNTLSVAALLILIVYPTSLWSISFQLSFTAVFFIIFVINNTKTLKIKGKLSKLNWLLSLALVTTAATIGTAPITAYYFNLVSFSGIIANLLIVPLVSTITVPLSLLSSLVLPVSESLSHSLFTMADNTIEIAYKIIVFIENTIYTHSYVSTPTLLEIILFYSIVITTLIAFKGNIKKPIPVTLTALLIFAYLYSNLTSFDQKNLKVTFINVGQGDSALIEIPRGNLKRPYTILVDSGGFFGNNFDTGRNIVAPVLWKKRITKVDTFILTHAQSDHMKGFNFLVEGFKPDKFIWNGVGDLKNLKVVLEKENTLVELLPNQQREIKIGDAIITYLHPTAKEPLDDMNDNSIVFLLNYKGKKILFTGDITEIAESIILKSKVHKALIKDIDILKIAHHGSKYSSSEAFLNQTSPEYAVSQLGRNNFFKFPHSEVLNKLEDNNIKHLRTDIDGAIEFKINKEAIEIKTYFD